MMKQFLIGLLFCCTAAITVQAQQPRYFNSDELVEPYRLDITWHKTTLIIFPSAIQSADRGDKYVLAQKVKGTDNILKIKAGRKGFDQSNLSVITADGRIYSFVVNYSNDPPYQIIDLRKDMTKSPAEFSGLSLNEEEIESYFKIISRRESFIHGIKQRKYQMKFGLQGIYIKDDVLFFRFGLNNKTQLGYNIDFLRFCIKDKRQAKRTAVQEKEIRPVRLKIYSANGQKTGETIVAAFRKFSIADDKNFIVEMIEKHGDRHFRLSVPQRKLLQAKSLLPLSEN